MNNDTMIERARKIVADHLDTDLEKVTDSASFIDDLGADSLDYIEIIMAFEEEFDVEILDDEAANVETFGQAVDLVRKHMAKAA